MILGNNVNGGVTLPKDVKEAVSKCRQATQNALQQKISRMDIEFPVGTKFGVEKGGNKKKSAMADAPTKSMLDQSDRELARLFVDMFQPVGGDNICVAFADTLLADQAKQKWKGDPTAACQILGINRKKKAAKKNAKTKAKGFAAKMAAEVGDLEEPNSGPFKLPEKTEVAIFVAPGPKELVAIEKICSEVGMGTLVILLNARLDKVDNFGTPEARELFIEEFESVFCLSAAPQQAAPDCLLFREYPGDWVMARKPKVGQPKPLLQQAVKPTLQQCAKVYDEIEIGDFEKGVESALENVSGWFR